MRRLTIQLEVEAPDNLITDYHLSVDVVGWVDMRPKGYDRRHLPIVKQMVTEEGVDPKALKPGDRIRWKPEHIRGPELAEAKIIERRKIDDSGWWLTDGSGLADYVFNEYWEHIEVTS